MMNLELLLLLLLLLFFAFDYECCVSYAQVLTGFTLIQPPDIELGPVPTTITLAVVGTSLNIQVETSDTDLDIDRVTFWWDGELVTTEFVEPYALGGDTNGKYDTYTPLSTIGSHTVVAEAYNSQNESMGRKSITFTVIKSVTLTPQSSPITVVTPTRRIVFTGFNLLLKIGDVVVKSTLTDFVVLSTLGSYVSIEALTASDANVAQVLFTFDGDFINTEGVAPWTLSGSKSFPPITTIGKHTLTVVAMTSTSSVLETKSISFTTVTTLPGIRPVSAPTQQSFQILGELRKWHKVTIAFTGPFATETNTKNPFMDYRLDVTFRHASSGKSYQVPGYFAADGKAAETSATSGNQWYCHFAPDEAGVWTFVTSFVSGKDVAVSITSGEPTSFHGQTGKFSIQNSNKTGRDHRGKGRLKYVGQHFLQFQETGEWFLKAGPDSPENFLAYDDFDNTPNIGDLRKSWSPHVKHFVTNSDPTWKNGKGKGIIGAINYLSNQGMNSFSFLTMNIAGDDENVYPYISSTEVLRMDVSKLAQWEIVFEHADKVGMFLHFKLSEQENDQLLDNGSLGKSRMLYYRELIARFGHHLALCWNLSEEITNTIPQIRQFSDYIKRIDPYTHIVVTHTFPYDISLYNQLIGYPTFNGPSLQQPPQQVFDATLRFVETSAAAKHKWIVTNDEQGPAGDGVVPDSEDPDHDRIRQFVLWGNIMAGGAGVEYYFGYNHDNSDLTCEDFTSRQNMWDQSRYALDFFKNNNIPLWQMSNRNDRVADRDWLLSSSDGEIHVLYRRDPNRVTAGILMDGLLGVYSLKWYNPRTGGSLGNGSISSIVGNGKNFVSFGDPPGLDDGKDWVLLLKRI